MNEEIQRMIDWIESRLQTDFSLDELAEYIGFSPYYCSFKFHQITGISIRRYTLLRRLYLSTEDLKNSRRIIDIAFDYYYSSQEAYSRAFKAVFGITPRQYQLHKLPVQLFIKLTIDKDGEWYKMNVSRKLEVEKLQNKNRELFDHNVLNILNGQILYEEFKDNQLMGEADYAPFNEAMCVHPVTDKVFDKYFVQTRAAGHEESTDNYRQKVIHPLNHLFNKEYKYIVLWFGEDMFCQMNLLTVLAYLEQTEYKGIVFLNSFREDEFKVQQTKLELGEYASVYKDVFIHHRKTSAKLFPVMYQAVNLYLDMLNEDNEVVKYISKHKGLPTSELLKRLFIRFPTIGYGDTQYLELINKI